MAITTSAVLSPSMSLIPLVLTMLGDRAHRDWITAFLPDTHQV